MAKPITDETREAVRDLLRTHRARAILRVVAAELLLFADEAESEADARACRRLSVSIACELDEINVQHAREAKLRELLAQGVEAAPV